MYTGEATTWVWKDKTYTGAVIIIENTSSYYQYEVNLTMSTLKAPIPFLAQTLDTTRLEHYCVDVDNNNTVYRQGGSLYFKKQSMGVDLTFNSSKANMVVPFIITHFQGDDSYSWSRIGGYTYLAPLFPDYTPDAYYYQIKKPMIVSEKIINIYTRGFYGLLDNNGLGYYNSYAGGLQDYIGLKPYGKSDVIKNFVKWLVDDGNGEAIDTDDPNPGGGNSTPGGGGGDGDIGGDTNPDDGLPTISALDSGLLTAYNPTVAELQSLGKFLWSDSFDVNTFKKLFNDPFDTLLGLSIIPITPNTSGSKNIMFGNLDSGVSAPVVANQWVTKDLGSVTLNEVWKGALDYAPSTSASIYLPFIGMRQLNINDVMGSTLHLIYKFDVLTGGCVAQIYINHNAIGNKDGGFSWTTNQGLVYEFMGQCAVNIPLASQDFTNTIRSAVSAVGMVAGASASIATGNPVLGIATATVASANLGMQANTPTVERSGHLSGSCAILGYNQPFLVVTRPHQCKPSRYYALRGVPSQVYTSKLSNCTGYTQITANNNIHCSGAQDSELQEIQNLLVSGVYFPDKKR